MIATYARLSLGTGLPWGESLLEDSRPDERKKLVAVQTAVLESNRHLPWSHASQGTNHV